MPRVALALGCLLLFVAGSAAAQADDWATDLSHELMSPFCPGRTLSACPSPQAKTLVVWLGVQQAAGRSREAVQAELVKRFGEDILPAPPARGFGLAAYAFPVLAFAAGGVLVWSFLRRQTQALPQAAEAVGSGPLDPELEAIVDRDLST
jgi:cytochrome c-type biogenesis protein CcmH/NrfF